MSGPEEVARHLGATGFAEAECRLCHVWLKLAILPGVDADDWVPLCHQHQVLVEHPVRIPYPRVVLERILITQMELIFLYARTGRARMAGEMGRLADDTFKRSMEAAW